MAQASLEITTVTSDGFGENGYVVRCAASGVVAVIDPGNRVEEILDWLEREGATPVGILLTHAHLDHLEGVAALKDATDAPIWLHAGDRPLYDGVGQQAAMFGMRIETLPPPDHAWAHGDAYRLGDCDLEVRHVPGHSPGHVILYSAEAGVAFVGDVVFADSIGRTDLPGGDYETLMSGIRAQVLSLPDETTLYPGHGPATSVGRERVGNPFLAPQFGGSRFA
ncbi:MAG TPA: MBL fold metallo-hydrolase [Longimicrobiales bacterium]|nr:MBL fold metallo-hydrolase [Longimicrobiales bacterium]